jgi:RNA polymerase sigma-70 factor (ECF subfamily)
MQKRKKFSKIYDRFIEKIYRFILLKVNSKEVAQDLTSETFLKTWQFFQENEIENFSAFLYQTARNLVIDHYRQKNKNQTASLENYSSLPDPKQNLEEKIFKDLEMERVQKAISQLKPDYQDLIVWRYLEGFSLKEISQFLAKSEGATRVLLHRALKSLREKIKEI